MIIINYVKYGLIRIEGIGEAEFHEISRQIYNKPFKAKNMSQKHFSNVQFDEENLDNQVYKNIVKEKCDLCELEFSDVTDLDHSEVIDDIKNNENRLSHLMIHKNFRMIIIQNSFPLGQIDITINECAQN